MRAQSLTDHSTTATIRRRCKPAVADNVFGMLVFVATEVMFFTALISAFVVIKAGIEPWAAPAGVRLPVIATAANSLLLVLSAVLLHQAGRWFAITGYTGRAQSFLGGAALLGGFFVVFQGYEWLRLIDYGLTMTSGIFGACFFLLIGTHGVHAAVAAVAMIYLHILGRRHRLRLDHLRAMQVFWYFVVGIWPLLYGLVYF